MRAAVTSATIFLAASCAGSSHVRVQPTSSVSPAPTTRSVPQSVKYSSGTTHFRAVSRVHQQQEIQGNSQSLDFLLEYFITTVLGTGTPGVMRMQFTIDSMHAEGGLVAPAEVSRAKGIRLTGTMGPDGRVIELTGDSILTGQLQSVAAAIKQFFPRIPATGVEAGAQWSDTTEIKTSGATQLVIHSINHRHAGDWTQYAGVRAVRIDVASNYTLSGTGQQMGQEFTLTGEGVKSTSQYLSSEGRYLGAASKDSSNFTVSLSAMGMTIPSIQIRSDTVAVAP
jgi:hypothetical protein